MEEREGGHEGLMNTENAIMEEVHRLPQGGVGTYY